MDINNPIYYDKSGNRYKLLKFPFYCENQIWCIKCPNMIQPISCFDKDFLESLSIENLLKEE